MSRSRQMGESPWTFNESIRSEELSYAQCKGMKADARLARAVTGLRTIVYAGVERKDLGALAEVVVIGQGPLQGLTLRPVVSGAGTTYIHMELVGSGGVHGRDTRGAVAAACRVYRIKHGIPVAAVLVVSPKHPGTDMVIGPQRGLARSPPLVIAQAKRPVS